MAVPLAARVPYPRRMESPHHPAHTTPARPDTRDWTFVTDRPCPDCGFVPGRPTATVADRVRAALPRWEAVLARPDVAVRPSPDVWSPLEYACHVLELSRVFTRRVELMRSEQDPTFPDWDGEVAAVAGDYNARDPRLVATDHVTVAHRAAELFDSLDEDAWHRTGRRGDGHRFTIATLADYWLHEVQHHLADVDG